MCPNCNKFSLCGCKSCKSRNKGRVGRKRTQKFINLPNSDSLIQCPYCRVKMHPDAWLDQEYLLRSNQIKDNG